MADALADALKARGVTDLRAVLAAQAGMAAFAQVTIAWLNDPEPGLDQGLREAASELSALLTSIDLQIPST